MIQSEDHGQFDRLHHDQIVFENVADQYVKGEDVKVSFSIANEIPINPEEDQIGLIRVGSNNIKDCLAYASIDLDPNGSTSHGSGTFSSAVLPMADDEFYQFCYIQKKRKNLGSSIPFQLNCSPDDIDLLTSTFVQTPSESIRADGLIAFPDQENDDLVVIHTKRMLTEEKLRQENRQLLDRNRRLEEENDRCREKFHVLDVKSTECIEKVKQDMQTLATSHKATIDELSTRQRVETKLRGEYEATMTLCSQYQTESLKNAERCRTLQDSNNELINEKQRLNSQLAMIRQLVDNQTTQIVDLEKSLLQSNDALKMATQQKRQFEQQYRDSSLTSEKRQLALEAQIDAYLKQSSQQENQLRALETANILLKEELNSVQTDKISLFNAIEEEKFKTKEIQQQLDELREQSRLEKEKMQQEIEQLKSKHVENQSVTNSIEELKKRCLKHQKCEIEVKKQLTLEKEHVVELQEKVEDLKERLLAGAEEYKTLFRKCANYERSSMIKSNPTTLSDETGLNEEALVSLLRNSYELQQQDQNNRVDQDDDDDDEEEKKIEVNVPETSTVEEEIRECPMCYWEFPNHLSLQTKKEHIEAHFN